jgi:trehalose 6-phosphate phosphatase
LRSSRAPVVLPSDHLSRDEAGQDVFVALNVDLEDIVESLRTALPDLLVAVDFDGTLAPLVEDPETSRPAHGTVEVLSALAAAGAQVAVITGRAADTVLRLGGLEQVPGIVVAGLYGVETWHAGELATPDTPEPLTELQQRLPKLLADHDAHPDVWIEDKRLSLVVHGRKAEDPDAALAPLRAPIGQLATELGLEMHPGRDVLELRLPGYDKAGALRRLAEQRAGVLYLGDDLGDVPAFVEIRRLREAGRKAYGVAVLSSGVPEVADAADAHVPTPDDVVALLETLAQEP